MISTIEFLYKMWNVYANCPNLNLGFVIKVKACEGVGQEWSPRVTFHAPWSVGECEGMNPQTPKWAATLGVGIPIDYRNFRGQF
jgi:hypothetical protein